MNVSKWLKYLSLFGYTTLIFGAELFGSQPAQTQTVVREFTPRYQTQAKGNISLIGNTLMTCDEDNTNFIGTRCPEVQSGDPVFSGNTNVAANNYFFMNYVDIDSDGSTFNSSSSQLAIPAGATVAWAGLYWSGDLSAGGQDPYTDPPGQLYGPGQTAPNPGSNNQAQLQVPGSGYQTIRADDIDQSGNRYSAYADVTSLVQAAGDGTYTMANVQAGTGGDRYAGWSLIVVYEDPNEKLRNLNVYDGFVFVNGPISTTISGFETPDSAGFEVELGAVTYEGDVAFTGDRFRLNGTDLSDGLNPADNFFNSSNTRLGSRFTAKDPDYVNQLAIDVDTVDATGLLNPGDTSALLEFTTAGDVYYPTAFTFSTEIKQPVLTQSFTKTVLDVNGGEVVAGDILEYEITLENTGNETATDVVISDPIPENTTLVDGSLEVIQDPNTGNIGTKTNASNDDTAELNNTDAVFRVGSGANATQGGDLAPGESVTVKFQVQIDSQINNTSNISNQASVNFNSGLTGSAFDGVSDDPNTPQQDDATNIKVADPIVCNGREIVELSFQNPQRESGTDLQVGATYRFSNVAAGIDALVTIDAFNNGASLVEIDEIYEGSPDAFQPELRPTTDPDSSVDFTISFVEGGTNTPVSVNAFNASGVDIDGDSGNIREYIELDGFTSYLLENPTSLTANYTNPTGRFESNTTATQPGISVDATQTLVTGEFTDESSFRYRIGALNGGTDTIDRLNSLSFDCIEFNAPQQNTATSLDYGDAPDTYGTDDIAGNSSNSSEPTGASHAITPNLFLGTTAPDADANGFVDGVDNNGNATDDDDPTGTGTGNGDDEDAFNTLPNVPSVGDYSLEVPLNSDRNATLHGWIDFDKDGKFEAGEYQSANVTSANTSANLTWNVPVGTTPGNSYVRLRLTSDAIADDGNTAELDERSIGSVSDGEVEDYPVTIEVSAIYDYGDAPDTSPNTGTGDYQTTSTNGGAAQVVIDEAGQVLSLGSEIDADNGSLQGSNALADDNDGAPPDDEDGVDSFPTLTTTQGQTYTVTVSARNNVPAVPAYLVGFIDFNRDGDFEDEGEQSATVTIPSDASLDPTATTGELRSFDVTFNTPAGMTPGDTYARFRLGQVEATAQQATGASAGTDNGEVEDYQITVFPSGPAYNGFCYYTDSFEWSDYVSGGLPVSVGGITINGGVVNTSFASSSTSRNHAIDTGTQGGEAGNYYLSMGSTTAGDYFDFQYTFDPGISNLSFRLIDVDAGGWTDIATVTASFQGNPVPVTLTAEGANVSVTGNKATGTGASNNTQTLGNVRVDIEQPVDTVDIRYEAGTASSQFIWIGDFGLCNSDYSDNPASYGDARHTISTTSNLHLGSVGPDDDIATTTLASAAADGDDTNNDDDEDAFTTVNTITASGNYELSVPITNTTGGEAVLHGWIDLDGDGQFSSSEHQQVLVADAQVSANLTWTVPEDISFDSTFSRFRITTDNLLDDGNTAVDERAIIAANNGEVEDYPLSLSFASDPNLLLVKRITAINPGQPDQQLFNTFIDDGTADNEDNDPNWSNPDTYLPGAINVTDIEPGDEVEYTIYFLSNGDDEATNVQICDVIPDNMTFVPDSYSTGSGIALLNSSASGATATNLTNANDTTDKGTFFAPSTALPKVTIDGEEKNLCQKVDSTGTTVEVDADNNTNGAVVVGIDEIPNATAPGTPTNSYGFIRFRAKVK